MPMLLVEYLPSVNHFHFVAVHSDKPLLNSMPILVNGYSLIAITCHAFLTFTPSWGPSHGQREVRGSAPDHKKEKSKETILDSVSGYCLAWR